MLHVGEIVKLWRSTNVSLQTQHRQTAPTGNAPGGSAPVAELEFRAGRLCHSGVEPGIEAADLQIANKRLTARFEQSPSATSGGLGRVVKWEEWHIEDVLYDNGIRVRESKLVSSHTAPLASGASSSSDRKGEVKVKQEEKRPPGREYVEKQRIAWTDLHVLQRKYDLRWSLKCERPVEPHVVANMVPTQRRLQTRRSFWVENYMRLDLSIVQQQQLPNVMQLARANAPTTSMCATPQDVKTVVRYELEGEFLPEAADALTDQQIVAHFRNEALDLEDAFGKINGCESVDGPLLVVQLASSASCSSSGPSPAPKTPQRAVATDVLFVPTTREICRPKSHNRPSAH